MRKWTAFGAIAIAFPIMCGLARAAPANFLYTSSGDLEKLRTVLKQPDIDGVQIVYTWRSLEPGKGRYDFSAIERDLAAADALGKKLFIQIQDRFFSIDARNVPDYLLSEPQYGGGLAAQIDNPGEGKPVGHGWVAMQWKPAVRERYQALLKALAEKFDGRVFGVNLPETAIDIDEKHDKTGFSCDAYFDAGMQNLRAARDAFTKSHVVQYVNFWPCEWDNDHDYMGRLFEYAAANRIGLGGPDIVPFHKAQMKNSYPFFHRYMGKLELVAMAVQEPTLTYRNPKTGKRFTKDEFVRFASDYLGVDMIFWSAETPWLKSAGGAHRK
ncbi:hypothetical protein [Mesorhizobium sp. RMAD-H1]|uniref:hypothetical protein n=1 Tax=Mesorhizobium sp. RMAD-H1 TaxID=2587065 RepID=UPI0017EB0BB1|nr:hypothetical protein [Mesorhizobium sp. RMAD-H1]MBB2971872.1 hypothetical protein [Mesorhizobium sp. RMAD-H1]